MRAGALAVHAGAAGPMRFRLRVDAGRSGAHSDPIRIGGVLRGKVKTSAWTPSRKSLHIGCTSYVVSVMWCHVS
eukprot:2329364-Pyramimonas_sp.AAC.1